MSNHKKTGRRVRWNDEQLATVSPAKTTNEATNEATKRNKVLLAKQCLRAVGGNQSTSDATQLQIQTPNEMVHDFFNNHRSYDPDYTNPMIIRCMQMLMLVYMEAMAITSYDSNQHGVWDGTNCIFRVHCSALTGIFLTQAAMQCLQRVPLAPWIDTQSNEYSLLCCAYAYAEAARHYESYKGLARYFDVVKNLRDLRPGDIVARGNKKRANTTGHVWIVLTRPDQRGNYMALHSAQGGIQVTTFCIEGTFGDAPTSDTFVGALRPTELAVANEAIYATRRALVAQVTTTPVTTTPVTTTTTPVTTTTTPVTTTPVTTTPPTTPIQAQVVAMRARARRVRAQSVEKNGETTVHQTPVPSTSHHDHRGRGGPKFVL